MNKKLVLILLSLLLVSGLVLAINGLTKEQKQFYNACYKNCSTNKMQDKRGCNSVSFECRNQCRELKNNRTVEVNSNYKNCSDTCKSLNITGNLTRSEVNKIKISCKRNCSKEKQGARKTYYSDYINCSRGCQVGKLECKKSANNNSLSCKTKCNIAAATYEVNDTDNETNETESDGQKPQKQEKIWCPRPRPEACIEVEDPVCSSRKTSYGNSCKACMDKKVRWYTQGAC